MSKWKNLDPWRRALVTPPRSTNEFLWIISWYWPVWLRLHHICLLECRLSFWVFCEDHTWRCKSLLEIEQNFPQSSCGLWWQLVWPRERQSFQMCSVVGWSSMTSHFLSEPLYLHHAGTNQSSWHHWRSQTQPHWLWCQLCLKVQDKYLGYHFSKCFEENDVFNKLKWKCILPIALIMFSMWLSKLMDTSGVTGLLLRRYNLSLLPNILYIEPWTSVMLDTWQMEQLLLWVVSL